MRMWNAKTIIKTNSKNSPNQFRSTTIQTMSKKFASPFGKQVGNMHASFGNLAGISAR